MAVNVRSYGTVTEVEALVGDLIEDRTFTSTTTPSLLQVERFIDLTAARINALLTSYNYSVPVSESDSPDAYLQLVLANSAAAADLALSVLPVEAIVMPGAPQDGIGNRKNFLWMLYKDVLEDIRHRRFSAPRIGWGKQMRVGTEDLPPRFRRDQFSHPATRYEQTLEDRYSKWPT